MSSLWDSPWPGDAAKWKRLETVAAQLWNGIPCKVSGQVTDCWGTWCIKVINPLLIQWPQPPKHPLGLFSTQWELHGMGFNGQAPPVGVLCWRPSNFIHVVCFAFIYGSRLELDIYQTKQQRIVIMCHSCFALNFKDVFSSKAELCRCVLCLEVTVFWEGRSTCSTISSKLFKKQTKLNSSVHKYSVI